jgi:hypothetical protein
MICPSGQFAAPAISTSSLHISATQGLCRLAIERRVKENPPYTGCPKEPGVAEIVAGAEDTTMRKAISELDDEQRAVLLEIADFGTAVFSSGLVVAILKSVVDLFV